MKAGPRPVYRAGSPVGVASGKANKEITADLGLSVRTVESYRESLIRKLGIPSAAGLTRFAIEARMLGN